MSTFSTPLRLRESVSQMGLLAVNAPARRAVGPRIAAVLLLLLGLLAAGRSWAQPCVPVEAPKQLGEVITFYAYAYHTNQFNQELRVSRVFKVSYNFDPRSGVDHVKIALRMSQDFMFYLKGMRLDDVYTPHPLATSTQKKGVFMCMNREAVEEHRTQYMESFMAMDKSILEEDEYAFEYLFNQYYKASTKVNIQPL